MKRFQKTLVYVSPDNVGTDPALERAAKQVRLHGGEITLTTVIEDRDLEQYDAPVFNLDPRAIITEHLQKRLEGLIQPLTADGLNVKIKLLRGKRVLALIREVVAGDYHLIMKTAHPKDDSGVRFGSIANRLMRQCPCPVWIAQPEQPAAIKRVLAAINPGADPSADLLSKKVLQLARGIAEEDSAELYALHVWHAYGEGVLKSHVSAEELTTYVDATKREAEQRFNRFVEATLGTDQPVQTRLLKGDAGRVIPSFANEERMDLVVMGSVGRSGLSGLVMGNSAEEAIKRVHCSLLTIKPDGFASPMSPQP